MTATALTIVPSAAAAPSSPSPAASTRVATPPLRLTAAARPLAVTELPDLLGDWLQRVVVPARAAAPSPPAAEPVVGATSLGNAVVNAWNAVLPWIDYGVELADYVLGFIPFGSLIGDQIDIVYFSLVRPVANSFVVDLVGPVLNEPLNPASYVNGLLTLGAVTVTSLINLGINEFNYFFGWLVPPIPPLPPRPPLVAETTEDEFTMAASIESAETTVTDNVDAKLLGEPPASEDTLRPDDEIVTGAEDALTAKDDVTAKDDETDETADSGPTTSTSGTVTAQGEVRDSGAPETEQLTDEETEEESKEVTAEAEDVTPADTDADVTTPTSPTDDDAASTDTTTGKNDTGDTSDKGDAGDASTD
ncbi:hypothetical protein A5765_07500 [Mycolicibacterium celeriflavum]|nr:hypothetical protein A5765_07500 [Mycolicibacterium celeriflavum]